ncbi:hypothetical protein WISP_35475 [Willisornis vidua]|uniref:Leucine-rich repeat-containing protein 56 n=1 Tax=Willisornis vidua TaxID=1566151 RepID=A0ABQ9DPF1_9PASS|nr:hypothetical protein WISP_35475 [Willisornis vidua]
MYFCSGFQLLYGSKNTTVLVAWDMEQLNNKLHYEHLQFVMKILFSSLIHCYNDYKSRSIAGSIIRSVTSDIKPQIDPSVKPKRVEMDLKWNPDSVSHLGSSAVRVTDLNWQGNLNPSLLIKDDGELLMEEHLSPRKLKVLTGVDDLHQVKFLEMRVDTREISLGNFGPTDYLVSSETVAKGHFPSTVVVPDAVELVPEDTLPSLASSSVLTSQNISEEFSEMQVYEVDRSSLLKHFAKLECYLCKAVVYIFILLASSEELYIAYNNISELSQLTWLDGLEVLDLEGNNIEDMDQMQYLRLCCKLSHLTVEGNLICLKPNAESAEKPDYNYRAEVKKIIPHLKYLDKIPASQTVPLPSKKMHEDCLIIKKSIKEGGLAGDLSWLAPNVQQQSLYCQCMVMVWFEALYNCALTSEISLLDPCHEAVARQSGCGPRPPTTSRPGNAQWSANVGKSSDAHLLCSTRLFPDLTVSDKLFTEDDSSDLTHGRTQDNELYEAMKSQQLSSHLENYMEAKYSLPGNKTIILCGLLGAYKHVSKNKPAKQRRPVMDESPSGEINHQHPVVCSLTKTSERFGPVKAASPLTARDVLQPLPDSTTATRTSQNRSLQS